MLKTHLNLLTIHQTICSDLHLRPIQPLVTLIISDTFSPKPLRNWPPFVHLYWYFIWLLLSLQKTTPPENTWLKIPPHPVNKLHYVKVRYVIKCHVTLEWQFITVGPLITSKLETHAHVQTWATLDYLWQGGIEKPFIFFWISLSFTHTHRCNSAFLSAVFPDEGQWNSESFCRIEEFLMRLMCARPWGSARDEADWLTHDCIITQ